MFKIAITTLIILTSVLLLYSVQSRGITASSGVSPLLTNCITNLCKAKNEWFGGTIGVRSDIDIYYDICNSPGCSFTHKGIWAKLNSTGRYAGVIIQADQSYPGHAVYYAQTYVPGVGLSNTVLANVPSGDLGSKGTFRIYWNATYNWNVGCVENLPATGTVCASNINTNRIWDIAILGFRVQSQSGYAIVAGFTGTQNQWQLGDNGQWYYQGVDGTMSNTASDWLYQVWQVRPSQSTNGGQYYGSCSCP